MHVHHLRKHLIQGLFVLAIAIAVSTSDLVIGTTALVAVLMGSLAMVEGGLWIIDRRNQSPGS